MRKPHWEIALYEQIKAASGRPFSYGTHDCATFAFDVRRAITGEDAAADWRGRYSTELGAARVMRRLGFESIEALATGYLGTPLLNVKLAKRGDIVLAGGGLGVCIGATAVFPISCGLRERLLRGCAVAWSVD